VLQQHRELAARLAIKQIVSLQWHGSRATKWQPEKTAQQSVTYHAITSLNAPAVQDERAILQAAIDRSMARLPTARCDRSSNSE